MTTFTNAIGAKASGVVVMDSNGIPQGAGVGTAGQVLTSNGAGMTPTFQASGSGALVLIQTQTATAQATLEFTTGITPTYNNYLLISSNVTGAFGGGTLIYIQFSANGGASYFALGYTGGVGVSLVQGFGSDTIAGSSTLVNLTSGLSLPQCVGAYFSTSSSSSSTLGGTYTAASIVVNALQVTTAGGPVFSGTFSLYGYVD